MENMINQKIDTIIDYATGSIWEDANNFDAINEAITEKISRRAAR